MLVVYMPTSCPKPTQTVPRLQKHGCLVKDGVTPPGMAPGVPTPPRTPIHPSPTTHTTRTLGATIDPPPSCVPSSQQGAEGGRAPRKGGCTGEKTGTLPLSPEAERQSQHSAAQESLQRDSNSNSGGGSGGGRSEGTFLRKANIDTPCA